MFKRILASVYAATALACSGNPVTAPELVAVNLYDQGEFSRFAQSNENAQNAISYGGFSSFMNDLVVDVGFPSRSASGRDGVTYTGTRIRRGSSEALALEANRIDFSQLSDEGRRQISLYRALIERLPSDRPLRTFNRNDQLAYWINLHNIVLIDEIARRYPLSDMKDFTVDTPGGKTHILDAKIVDIEGVALSLNDIRVGIVYRYWSDQPEVLYGFFLGTLGGPSIIPRAYTAQFVDNYLNRNASEFINSRRGVRPFFSTLYVSPIYEAHREIFFQNWPADLFSHFKKYARSPVRESINDAKEVKFVGYTTEVAAVFTETAGFDQIGPGAPAAQAVSRDATGAVAIVGTADPGPLGGPSPNIDTSGLTQSRGSVAGSVSEGARGDFYDRIETKRARSPQDFWPEIERRDSRVRIIDVPTEDPDEDD